VIDHQFKVLNKQNYEAIVKCNAEKILAQNRFNKQLVFEQAGNQAQRLRDFDEYLPT